MKTAKQYAREFINAGYIGDDDDNYHHDWDLISSALEERFEEIIQERDKVDAPEPGTAEYERGRQAGLEEAVQAVEGLDIIGESLVVKCLQKLKKKP